MMFDILREQFEPMENERLLEIWQANDRNEYSDEVYTVIRDILKERKIEIPDQKMIQAREAEEGKKKGPRCVKCGNPDPILFDFYFGEDETSPQAVLAPVCEACGSGRKWMIIGLVILGIPVLLFLLTKTLGAKAMHENATLITISLLVGIPAMFKANPRPLARQIAWKIAEKQLHEKFGIENSSPLGFKEEEIKKNWKLWPKWKLCQHCRILVEADAEICPSCNTPQPLLLVSSYPPAFQEKNEEEGNDH